MRWLRFIALVIFVFLTGYTIQISWKAPIVANIILTLVLILITLWVASGFFKKPKQMQYR